MNICMRRPNRNTDCARCFCCCAVLRLELDTPGPQRCILSQFALVCCNLWPFARFETQKWKKIKSMPPNTSRDDAHAAISNIE